MSTPPVTHLVTASEAAGWHSAMVTVCGELASRAQQPGDDDLRYCLECVRAAAEWSATGDDSESRGDKYVELHAAAL